MNGIILLLLASLPLVILLPLIFKGNRNQNIKEENKNSLSISTSSISSGTEMVEKSKLSISIILVLLMLSIISIMTMSFFIDKKYSFFFYILGSAIFIPIGIAIGAIFSSNLRVKLLRAILKKNIGFVKFVMSGKIIKPVLVNLDNDIIRFGDGIYIINKDWIKRETFGQEGYSHKKIDQEMIKYEEGIPTIYFDVDDIMPIDFDISNKNTIEKYRIPSQVSATLNKEIAVEKAKVMNAFGTRQSIFMLVTIACMLILLYFAWSSSNSIKEIKKIVDVSKNDMSIINSKLSNIEESIKKQILIGNSTQSILLTP